MNQGRDRAASVWAFTLGLAWISLFYGKVLVAPNDFLFSADGDGIKNYYTFLYSIRHLFVFEAFDGMNYPYGERSIYTDNHPIFAFLLQLLSRMHPAFSDSAVGILNLLILFSIPLSAAVLQSLYSGVGLKSRYSVPAALATAVLAPQIHRWTGHLSLAHAWYIPVGLLFVMRWERGRKNLSVSLGLMLWVGLGLLIHPYLGMMLALFTLCYALLRWFETDLFPRPSERASSIWLAAFSLFPVLLFFATLSATETHTHRTDKPWGIKSHMAEPETVFLPTHRPLRELGRLFDPTMNQIWEGWAYVGFFAALFSALMLFRWLRLRALKSLSQSERKIAHPPLIEDRFVKLALGSSVLVLLWSMAIPLRWLPDAFVDALGPIRQFRALGRFAWVYFYVVQLALFHVLCGVRVYSMRAVRSAVAYFVPLFMILESIEYHQVTAKDLLRSPNVFSDEGRRPEWNRLVKSIKPEEFQAILPMPFFHIGSENFERIGSTEIHRAAFVFSHALGLPMMGGSGSRTALLEAKAQVQWMSEPGYPKLMQSVFEDPRPLLLICQTGAMSAQERYYRNRSRLIGEAEGLELRSAELEIFRSGEWADSLRSLGSDLQNQAFRNAEWWVSDTNLRFYSQGYEERHHPAARFGIGAFEGSKREFHQLAEIRAADFPEGEPIEASFWMFNGGAKDGQDRMLARVYWIESGPGFTERWLEPSTDPRQCQTIDGDWSRVVLSLVPEDRKAVYRLIFKGPDDDRGSFLIDELLIRPQRLQLGKVEKGTGTLWLNNHRISR